MVDGYQAFDFETVLFGVLKLGYSTTVISTLNFSDISLKLKVLWTILHFSLSKQTKRFYVPVDF